MARNKAPSNAVKTAAIVGTPAAVIGGYVASIVSSKYGVPFEVAGAGIALLAHGFTTLTALLSRGGRRGEAD